MYKRSELLGSYFDFGGRVPAIGSTNKWAEQPAEWVESSSKLKWNG